VILSFTFTFVSPFFFGVTLKLPIPIELDKSTSIFKMSVFSTVTV